MKPEQDKDRTTNEIAPGVCPMPYGELAKLDIPPPSWIVDKFVPDESITIISALPARFKTWLAFDIAVHVALGKLLFSQFEVRQTGVLIVDEESGLGRLRDRLQRLGATDGIPIDVASYNDFKITKDNAKSLINYCKAKGIGLVIFDSFTRMHDADDNNAKEMAVVMSNFKQLARAGLAVLIIHHDRKPAPGRSGGANEMRGSVDILAACDVQISLKISGDRILTVMQNKNRDAENIQPFQLEVCTNEDSFWFEYKGNAPKSATKNDDTDNAILKLLADGEPRFQKQIIEALKDDVDAGSDKTISSRLKVLSKVGKLTRSTGANNKHLYALLPEQPNE